jgi:hypothetical protein
VITIDPIAFAFAPAVVIVLELQRLLRRRR